MATFSEAVQSWTADINEWYFQSCPATDKEVRRAFRNRFIGRKAYNGKSYVSVFFKIARGPDKGTWRLGLDTADREDLADAVIQLRKEGKAVSSTPQAYQISLSARELDLITRSLTAELALLQIHDADASIGPKLLDRLENLRASNE